jgi:hypothetical protein
MKCILRDPENIRTAQHLIIFGFSLYAKHANPKNKNKITYFIYRSVFFHI